MFLFREFEKLPLDLILSSIIVHIIYSIRDERAELHLKCSSGNSIVLKKKRISGRGSQQTTFIRFHIPQSLRVWAFHANYNVDISEIFAVHPTFDQPFLEFQMHDDTICLVINIFLIFLSSAFQFYW